MRRSHCGASGECVESPSEVAVDQSTSRESIKLAHGLLLDIDPAQHSTLSKLLVEEEDRFGYSTERLELAERRLASGRKLVTKQQSLITRLAAAGIDTSRANLLLTLMLEAQALFEAYRQQILNRLKQVVNDAVC
jgi:hypothetical protein